MKTDSSKFLSYIGDIKKPTLQQLMGVEGGGEIINNQDATSHNFNHHFQCLF